MLSSVKVVAMAAAGIGIAASGAGAGAWKFFRSDDPSSTSELNDEGNKKKAPGRSVLIKWLAGEEHNKEEEEEEVGVALVDLSIYDQFEDGSESSSRKKTVKAPDENCTIFSINDHDSQHHRYEVKEMLAGRSVLQREEAGPKLKEKGKEVVADVIAAGMAVAAVAGVALLGWGISKLLDDGSDSSRPRKKMKAPGENRTIFRDDFEADPAAWFHNSRLQKKVIRAFTS